MSPLTLDSACLQGARAALAPPARQPLRARVALGCAGLMTTAALAMCAVVVLGGWTPQEPGPLSGIHARLARPVPPPR